MPLFDFPLEKLRTYNPPDKAPKDFDAFWSRTLKEQSQHPLDPTFEEHADSEIFDHVDVYDASFAGYGGTRIKAWFFTPAGATKPLPTIINYVGYGGGRSLPVDHVNVAAAGFAYMVMDTRGQGSVWSPGHTPDDHPDGQVGPQVPGFMTRGIQSRETYYYRRLFTDAARAIDAAASHPLVDAKRIALQGGSQGGGISIAAAALAPKKVKLLMADVPFLCHYRRATEILDTNPYAEISTYLKTHRGRTEDVFATLAYFDGMHFAPRITARTLFSVGLMDNICPPSTIFAAYNRITAKKDILIYDYNNHEGGGMFHATERLRYAKKHL